MTHIRGPKEWCDAIFKSFIREKSGALTLTLSDNSIRTMNDWNEDTKVTEKNLENLKMGDVIRVATWGGWNKQKWFCDVEKINF
jgi:hypothetical protein